MSAGAAVSMAALCVSEPLTLMSGSKGSGGGGTAHSSLSRSLSFSLSLSSRALSLSLSVTHTHTELLRGGNHACVSSGCMAQRDTKWPKFQNLTDGDSSTCLLPVSPKAHFLEVSEPCFPGLQTDNNNCTYLIKLF